MRPFQKSVLLAFFVLPVLSLQGQELKSTTFYSSIKTYNLSKLWRNDSIQLEGDEDKVEFPEPLGFIGDNYQRFYIHYTSVTKSKTNPYEYMVSGKTKVKENICTFKGTILIKEAELYKESDDPRYKQGNVVCQVKFYEDSSQPSSGFMQGTLTTYWYLDNKRNIHYDALMAFADSFSNNECTGTWTSYKTKKNKKCNWGDYRIPDCGDLDIGAGEFSVNDKYVSSGWQTYRKAWIGDPNLAETKKARAEELQQWWK